MTTTSPRPLSPEHIHNTREWIKDLRSGAYSQCTHTLSDGKGYCCLGVMCLTGDRLGIPGAGLISPGSSQRGDDDLPDLEFWGRFNMELFRVKVPESLARSHSISFFNYNDPWEPEKKYNLGALNDTHGLTFSEIADCLEHTFPELKE